MKAPDKVPPSVIMAMPPEKLSQKCDMRVISVDTMLEAGMRFIKMAEAQKALAQQVEGK